VLELDGERATVVGKHEIGRTFIDESGFEEIARETVRERRQLAYDGVVSLVVTINAETGTLETPPEITARGLTGTGASNGFLKNAQRIVTDVVEKAPRAERDDLSLLKERLRVELKRFIQKQTGAKPVILPIVVEV
jgi:ribonuclease J